MPIPGLGRVCLDTGYLLRVQGQIITKRPGGFLRRDLAEEGDIVENRGDIIEQGEKIAPVIRISKMM